MSSVDIYDIFGYALYVNTRHIKEDIMSREQLQRLSEPMYYLLLSLIDENHGYAIMQDIKMLSNNRVNVGTGTLYALLARFEQSGYIKRTREEERKKYYQITQEGIHLLKEEYHCLKQQIVDGNKIDSL